MAVTFSVSSTSVTTPMPVSARALARIRSPSLPRPWKAYGLVRGLYAPARISFTPRPTMNCAVSMIIFSFSTEQGPAMMVKPSPTRVLAMGKTLLSGCVSRATRACSPR